MGGTIRALRRKGTDVQLVNQRLAEGYRAKIRVLLQDQASIETSRRECHRVAIGNADRETPDPRPPNSDNLAQGARPPRPANIRLRPLASACRRAADDHIDGFRGGRPDVKTSCIGLAQQGHWEMLGTTLRDSTSRSTISSVKQLCHSPPRQRQPRVAPLPCERRREPRHDGDQLLAAAKCQQLTQIAALRDQRLIRARGREQRRLRLRAVPVHAPSSIAWANRSSNRRAPAPR